MGLENCANCGQLFVKNSIRDICENCYREEEAAFEKVNVFLKKRENRTASMVQIINETGVEEALILKFIKKGRIRLVQFPNLAYPCEKCGRPIKTGKICETCMKELRTDLDSFEKERARQAEIAEREKTYFTMDETARRKK
ncbi:TIGR03826 family flagellar region protein [Bacillus kwashiorkori]|uniref:TIGR03826 family flagellar region protein n=1 Tax=Bacillus kwashiorkori TaxID=1522318 RepID=UPI000784B22A|nr:TIGR03826 family flagellar region protein [Bacillus kwashiorkori]